MRKRKSYGLMSARYDLEMRTLPLGLRIKKPLIGIEFQFCKKSVDWSKKKMVFYWLNFESTILLKILVFSSFCEFYFQTNFQPTFLEKYLQENWIENNKQLYLN
jgi:hypothetical protein